MDPLTDFTILAAIYLVIEVIGLLLAADAVMRSRSSQGAIAWLFSLAAMPVIAIPFYLIFGRTRFRGYAEALREKELLLEDQTASWRASMQQEEIALPPAHARVEAVVKRLGGLGFTGGNEVTLLVNGAATYEAMYEAIEEAVSYVLVQFYIVKDGSVSRRLKELLIDKAGQGVRVFFLYDEIGCLKLPPSYLEELRAASIQVSGFKTTQGRQNRFQINFRNHRKLLIVDGKIGFIGGHNLADEYLDFRDTHARILGPAVQQIQLAFLKDWFWATRVIPEFSSAVVKSSQQNYAVAILKTGPADHFFDCSVVFSTIVHSARQRLWITSPYFVPDDIMVRALQTASIRGVDVRIMIPGKADHHFVELASLTYYDDMKKFGVKIYRYQEKFLHQKVFIVDDWLAGVGTVNLDNRSLYLNFEATAFIADAGFVEELSRVLETDFEHSILVEPDYFDKLGLPKKVAARVARLASPLL
jgi:cardiolipin synthase